jgi:hypothetical protein
MLNATIVAEPVIRLSCFVGVLLPIVLWEAITPRRPQSVRRLLHWPNKPVAPIYGQHAATLQQPSNRRPARSRSSPP